MVQAVIFDMDGLLVDSEPFWHRAERTVLGSLGIPQSDLLAFESTGLRTDEVVDYWYRKYPWDHTSKVAVGEQMDSLVVDLIRAEGKPMPGVHEVIALCQNMGLTLALASSSSMILINAVVQKLELEDKIKVLVSAESEKYGKPHPGVYIETAKTLGIHPNECLALEDSVNGVVAAKAASMFCIAVPDGQNLGDKRFGIADFVVPSLRDITDDMIQGL